MKRTLKLSILLTAVLAFFVMAAYFSAPVHAEQTLSGGTYNASSLGSDPDIVFNGDATIIMNAPLSVSTVKANGYDLKISGTGALTLSASGNAIFAKTLTLDGVTLNITKVGTNSRAVIEATNASILNSNITLTDKNAVSDGIFTSESIKIDQSTIDVDGKDCIHADRKIEISDSLVTLESSDDCLSGFSSVTLKGCTLDFNGRYGIYSTDGEIDIENCTGTIDTEYTDILAHTGATVTGSTLGLTSGTNSEVGNIKVSYSGALLVDNSKLTCICHHIDSASLYNAYGDIKINGSEVNITCPVSDAITKGIQAPAGGVSAEGSTLTISAETGICSYTDFSLKNTDYTTIDTNYAIDYAGSSDLTISGGNLCLSSHNKAIYTEYADILIDNAALDVNGYLYIEGTGSASLTNCTGKIITTNYSAISPCGDLSFKSCDLSLTGGDVACDAYKGKITLSDDIYIKSPKGVSFGEFNGSKSVPLDSQGKPVNTIVIAKKRVSDDLCTVDPIPEQTYDGTPVTPAVVVKWDGTVLVKDKDYTVTYLNNNAGGTGTATITGKGIYSGTVSKTFPIKAMTALDGTALGKGANAKLAEAAILSSNSDEGPSGSVYSGLQAKASKTTKTSIKLTWKKVKGAKKYYIYANACGKGKKYQKLGTFTGKSATIKKVAGKKLKKGTYYKFMILAVDSSDKVVTASKTVHAATAGGKVGNPTKVTTKAKKNKVTVKAKKTFKLAAKQAGKKIKKHRAVSYETSDAKIATVSKKGVIKGVKKGTCYVYAYAQNGVCAKIKVTVK